MAKFALTDQELVGSDHRVGWPAVVSRLRAESDKSAGLLLDDFVERSFTYPGIQTVHRQPWVGIFHHTPRMPAWMVNKASPQNYLQSSRFRESLPYLKAVITLSEYTANWYGTQLALPAAGLRYALPQLGYTWRPTLNRRVWQFGWYLRNTSLLDQIQTPLARLKPKLAGVAAEHAALVEAYWRQRGNRATHPGVQVVDRLTNADYDAALQQDLVAVEYFDVGASTLLLECLAAATPVVCGYHPAIAEYLGADYPLYADGPHHFAAMLTDENAIMDAHAHLRECRKQACTLDGFMLQLHQFLDSIP